MIRHQLLPVRVPRMANVLSVSGWIFRFLGPVGVACPRSAGAGGRAGRPGLQYYGCRVFATERRRNRHAARWVEARTAGNQKYDLRLCARTYFVVDGQPDAWKAFGLIHFPDQDDEDDVDIDEVRPGYPPPPLARSGSQHLYVSASPSPAAQSP